MFRQNQKKILRFFCVLLFPPLLIFIYINAEAKPEAPITSMPNQSLISPSSHLVLDFSEIKTRDLLQLIGKESGKNVIISEKIGGNSTIHLNNVTWKTALSLVLRMNGLAMREEASVIFIAPATDLSTYEQLQRAQEPEINAVTLHHANAETVANLITKTSGMLASAESVIADKRTNTLLLQVNANKVFAIKELVRQIDLPLKQIVIKAQIVCVDENFMRELGVKFGVAKAAAPTKKDSNIQMDLPLESFDSGRFNLTIAKLTDASLLALELDALESEGRGKIISSPKLLTADREMALIESGAEIPYQEKATRGGTNVAFKKAALSLKVVPEIVGKNMINLSLQLNQDKVGQVMINGVPTIDTHKIQTQVLVKNGETVVLGGIYEYLKSNHTSIVPGLGRIPLIGGLFRSNESRTERKELLIFVTPKIVAD
jgi:type IV pilus assembly protein PilQ